MILVRPATQQDCHTIGPYLRQEDKDEIQASSGLQPTLALLRGLEASERCYTVICDGEPMMMCGVVRMGDNPSVGQVWALGTDTIRMHSIEFLRKSREWRDFLHLSYPVLFNNIDARNTTHIKWLQWLDFQFINELHQYGHEGRTFYHFVRISNV